MRRTSLKYLSKSLKSCLSLSMYLCVCLNFLHVLTCTLVRVSSIYWPEQPQFCMSPSSLNLLTAIERGKNTLSSLARTFILLSHSYIFPLPFDAFHLIHSLKLCVCVICPMICLVSSSVIVHILFRGISASFVPWMLANKSFASANLEYTTTEYKQQGIITDLILVERKLLHLAWKRLTA